MRKIGVAGIAAMALGSMFAVPPNARAAEGGHMAMYEGIGRSSSSCPAISWVIHPVGAAENGGLSGVLWYLDMSGVSLARGTMQKDGKFTLSLTPVSGSGPTGTVVGTRAPGGALMADLNGPGCSMLHVRMQQMDMPLPGSG